VVNEQSTPARTAGKARKPFWMKLDNAAKIYPAVQNTELTAVFRLSCVLNDRIRVAPLIKAIHSLEERFPYYKVKPNSGFFWHYLEFHDEVIPLQADLNTPCRAFEKDDLMFRVLARDRKLSVEFSHILTDGAGAFEFLKALLLQYFEALGMDTSGYCAALEPGQQPAEEEFEDGFSKYFQENVPSPGKKPRSFHLPFALSNRPRFRVLMAKIPISQISERSKAHKVSITEYLVSVYLHALQMIYNGLSAFQKRRHRKIFRIQVPVNLRKIYPSKTMRNFSLFVTPEIDLALGSYSFEEIVKTVHHLMQLETDKKLINKMIARNVGAERNVWLKNTPLFIKTLILYFTYSIAGTSRYSGVITNLGKVSFGSADRLIDYFAFIPPPPNKTLKVNCGVLGFDNNLVLSFGSVTESRQLERDFIAFLMSQGISVKIINY
jgi:NRPS condensation-like uncharacterized protein